MKFLFHNDAPFNKLDLYVLNTWKCLRRGEGEEEIANHGWSRVKSFSQETEAIGQQGHGVTELSRSYTLKSQVQDARDSRTLTPLFSFFFIGEHDEFRKVFRRGSFSLRTVLALFFLSFVAVIFDSIVFIASLIPTVLRNLMKASPAENFSKFSFLQYKQFWGVIFALGLGMAPYVASAEMVEMPSRFMGKPKQKSADEKLKDVSKMYEKHFLGEMMKAMRSTVHESGFIQVNQAEKIFREQLDGEYVDKWSEKGGIGLSQVIYDQLVEKYGAQLGIKKKEMRLMGPIALDEKSNFTAHQFRHPGRSQEAMSYRISRTAPPVKGAKAVDATENQVKAPWGGVLRAVRNLVDKQTMVEIEHDNGLKSQVVFLGAVSQIETGQKVQAGETLGILSPEAKSLYWTVEPDHSTGQETVSE